MRMVRTVDDMKSAAKIATTTQVQGIRWASSRDADYGLCEQPPPVLTTETATVTGLPGTGDALFFLVTARNTLAEEGPKGFDYVGVERGNPVPCP